MRDYPTPGSMPTRRPYEPQIQGDTWLSAGLPREPTLAEYSASAGPDGRPDFARIGALQTGAPIAGPMMDNPRVRALIAALLGAGQGRG